MTCTLSAGLTPVTPAAPGPDVIWHLGDLDPGQKVALDVSFQLDAGLAPGDFVSNTVWVRADNEDLDKLDNNVDHMGLRVLGLPQADLQVTKYHAFAAPDYVYGKPAYRGLPFDYSLSVRNRAKNCAATDVVAWDTLPAGLSYVAAFPTPASVNGQVLTWDLGTMLAGDSTEITITVQVDPDVQAGEVLQNLARVSSSAYDHDEGNNVFYFNTAINDIWDLYLPIIVLKH